MTQTEKELEKQLMEAGNHLLNPPSSPSDLVALLDRVEIFLTRVEQSPSESMKEALSISVKALITNDLLRHSDVDVKVSVASCISEITRIAAPDAPYEDDEMKEVFQLIVSSFEQLDDKNSPSFKKRISILETMAKVRSCVVMLDLECDALIIEMFQHFLRSVRDDLPQLVFSSMETIMTLVLEESEDISLDLLSPILDVLKTENKEILPVARQLGEKVIEKCANKLKPYLLPAVESRGVSLDDYSKVVANVCQMEPEAVEPSDVDTASKNLAEASDMANAPSEKAVEVAMETLDDAPPSEEVGPTPTPGGSPKSVMSNGTLNKEIVESLAGDDNSKEVVDSTHDKVDTDGEPSKTKAGSLDAEEISKPQFKPEKANKRKGKKTNSLKGSSESSQPTHSDGKKDEVDMSEHQEKDSKDVENTHSDAENEKESKDPIASPKTSSKEPVDIPSRSPSPSLADEIRSRKFARVKKKKDDSVQESEPVVEVDSKKKSDTKKASKETSASKSKSRKNKGKKPTSTAHKEESVLVPSPVEDVDLDSIKKSDTKKASEGTSVSEPKTYKNKGKKPTSTTDKEESVLVPSPAEDVDLDSIKKSDTKKASEGTSVSEPKTYKNKGKKPTSTADKEESIPSPVDSLEKEDGKTMELDAKSANKSGKKIEVSSTQRGDKKKRGQGKGTPAKDLAKTPSKDDNEKLVSLSKSAAKSTKDESDMEKTSKTSTKRKRSPGEKEVSKIKSYGKELVGSKIKVWWPDDQKFYEGVVDSFISAEGKHKILYIDGDEETLKLEEEIWKTVDDETVPDQGYTSDGEIPDEPSEMPKGKKAKAAITELGTKRGKTETSAKKGGASSSKSKATPKSGGNKQKDNNKVDNKSEEASKSVSKSKDSKVDTPKSAGKPKDDNKSKQESPIVAGKSSKGKSSKSGGKSNNTNGTGKAKASLSSKDDDEELEDVEKSPEPEKTTEKTPENAKGKKSPNKSSKSQKSGKKRKR